MKTITMFYLENCPYCKNARKALKELTEENPEYGSISVDMIEESQNPEKADAYDYYYVPALFLGNERHMRLLLPRTMLPSAPAWSVSSNGR